MKIIHTADWHLGQSFKGEKRLQEQSLFLDWLLDIIETEEIDALLIAGDVFDITNPPTESIKMFYDFVKKVSSKATQCRIYLISGNHDSTSRLDAPKELLLTHNCYSIAYPDLENISSELFPLYEKGNDKPVAYLLALPYSGYGRFFQSIDYSEEMSKKLSELSKEAKKMHPELPLIGMAHLFAGKGTFNKDDDSLRNVGTLDQVKIGDCSFDYLALGHLHRQQSIESNFPARYSGSPITLSFAETGYKHGVDLITIENGEVKYQRQIEYNSPVKLVRIPEKGEVDAKKVIDQIKEISNQEDNELAPLVEIHINEVEKISTVLNDLRKAAKENNIRLTGIYSDLPQNSNQEFESEELNGMEELQGIACGSGIKLPEPEVLAEEYYQKIYGKEMTTDMRQALNDIIEEAKTL